MINQQVQVSGNEAKADRACGAPAVTACGVRRGRKELLPARRRGLLLAAGACILALSACTYYVPTTVPGAPASFDRSFNAASGAMRDQGLAITVEDRSTGRIVGAASAGGTVGASVRSQADGTVRVQFDSQDLRDANLLDRVVRAYETRMGR